MSDVNPDLQIFKFYKRRQRLPQDDGKLYYRADGYMHGLFERRSVRELLKPFRVRHLERTSRGKIDRIVDNHWKIWIEDANDFLHLKLANPELKSES